jgi:hypothetical protein
MDRCLAASQARGLAGAQDPQGLVPILRVRVYLTLPTIKSGTGMSVSLVPLIYLNRSDLCVTRSANVARYQPYPYRAMLAGHSMPSRPTGSAWRPHQGWAPIAVLIHAIPSRVSTEDTGTAIEG